MEEALGERGAPESALKDERPVRVTCDKVLGRGIQWRCRSHLKLAKVVGARRFVVEGAPHGVEATPAREARLRWVEVEGQVAEKEQPCKDALRDEELVEEHWDR